MAEPGIAAPPSITLSGEQEAALKTIQGGIDAAMAIHPLYGGAELLLEGFAGTGKTVSLQELVRRNPKLPIVLTAPTNKAVKVLLQKNRAAGLSTDCMTIYKLLGVKPGNSDEKRSLKKTTKSSCMDYRVVIIDECSMLGADIMKYIREHLNDHIVIYVGDPKQLPPVKEEISRSFRVSDKATLTTIMRQRDQNPIIALTAAIRSMIDDGEVRWDAFAPANGSDGSGIYHADGNFKEWILDGFLSDEFKADNDAYRYLAWTNNTVADINRMVRAAVYGANAPPFVEGERLMFRRPAIKVGGARSFQTLFSTDEEAVIKSVEMDDGPEGVPVWRMEMRSDEGVEGNIIVVTDEGKKYYDREEQRLKRAARQIDVANQGKIGYDRTPSGWPSYFFFCEQFSEVQSVYALTIHRSQGSTFGTAFFDLLDISKNADTIEMLKLLYVAASRPSKFLVI